MYRLSTCIIDGIYLGTENVYGILVILKLNRKISSEESVKPLSFSRNQNQPLIVLPWTDEPRSNFVIAGNKNDKNNVLLR